MTHLNLILLGGHLLRLLAGALVTSVAAIARDPFLSFASLLFRCAAGAGHVVLLKTDGQPDIVENGTSELTT